MSGQLNMRNGLFNPKNNIMTISLGLKKDSYNTYATGVVEFRFNDEYVEITIDDRRLSLNKKDFLQTAQAIHMMSDDNFSVLGTLMKIDNEE